MRSKQQAGDNAGALATLATAKSDPLDEIQRALVDLIRAEITFASSRSNDAPGLLLRAAERLLPLDLRMARDTYFDAMLASHFAGRLAREGGRISDTAQAALRAPHPVDGPTASDLLADGIATAFVHSYADAAPTLRAAVEIFSSPGGSVEDSRWLWPAAYASLTLWGEDSYEILATRQVDLGRQTGIFAMMPNALQARCLAQAFVGDLSDAEKVLDELRVLTDAMGIPMLPYEPLVVSGWRGRERDVLATVATLTTECQERGEGACLAFADYARALLCKGLGQYQGAQAAAERVEIVAVEGLTVCNAILPELIEAAVRSNNETVARDALGRLLEMTIAAGTNWSAGIGTCCQALLAPTSEAEDLFREAIELLGRTRIRPQLARTHLLYGEWLRRRNRRADARQHLRTALEMLSAIGAEAFADRARRELLATGEKIGRRTEAARYNLTAQELQIAHLAGEGHTNAEIGAQLFISTRTVEWHLRKVFAKLGILSRRELRGLSTNL